MDYLQRWWKQCLRDKSSFDERCSFAVCFQDWKESETRWAEQKRNRQIMVRQKRGAWVEQRHKHSLTWKLDTSSLGEEKTSKNLNFSLCQRAWLDEFVFCCFHMSCFHGHFCLHVSGRLLSADIWMLTEWIWSWKLPIIKVSAKPVLISFFTWECCLHFALRVLGFSHKRLWDDKH